jgi:hypothetical protein
MVRSFLVPLLLAGALFAAVSAQDVEVQHKSNSCVVKGNVDLRHVAILVL